MTKLLCTGAALLAVVVCLGGCSSSNGEPAAKTQEDVKAFGTIDTSRAPSKEQIQAAMKGGAPAAAQNAPQNKK